MEAQVGRALVVFVALAAALGGCGGDDESDDGGAAAEEGAVADAADTGTAAADTAAADTAAADTAAADTAAGGGSVAEVVAIDIGFEPTEISVPAGPVEIKLKNDGAIVHTLLIDGVGTFDKLEVATTGDTDAGTLEADPGTYVFYCDQPGHRAAGMEGKLTVG